MVAKAENSGLGFANLALTRQRRTLFHLEAHGAHGSGNYRRGSKSALGEITVAVDLSLNHGFLSFQVALHGGVFAYGQATFGTDVSID